MLDPLNLLPRLSNLLGGRDNPISLFPQNPLGGPESDVSPNNPANGPDAGDPGLDAAPRGQQGRDSIPHDVARQLNLPAPPAPPPLPGALPNPGGPQSPNFPNAPLSAPSLGGNAPAIPTSQPLPATVAQSLPASQPAILLNPGSLLGQASQAVQSLVNMVTGTVATATTRGGEPNLPTTPATPRTATANPVPPPAAPAQSAQIAAMPLQTGVTVQPAGAPAQPAGLTTNPNAANPAAAMPAGRPGGTEAAAAAQLPQQTQPAQGRTDAVPLQQRPEGSLLDRLMSFLRPSAANTAAQGSTAPNSAAAGAAQAAGTTAVAMPLAVAATQAPTDPRGNVLLAVNDRAGIQRADAVLAGVYTADGPYRRGLRRGSNVLSAQFSRLLTALGLAGPPVTMRGRDAEYELSVALQWLFWLLAIVAYACLGLAVIAFLPAGSDVFGDSGRGWTTGFAFAGLFAAAGAWWFARQLSGRKAGDAGPESDPENEKN